MKTIGDIDIDVKPNFNGKLYGVKAINYDPEKLALRPHPSGYYIDANVPVDPVTGMSTMHYKDMERVGFIKIDLLSNSSYQPFKSKVEVLEAAEKEPDWSLLDNEDFVKHLPHIGSNFELVQHIKPQSVEEVADVLALMRPAKIKYIDDYIEDRERVRKNLYKRASKGYYIKRSHAIAYALMIVCVMNKNDYRGLLKYGNS
ncbi:MAG: hypothetical protein KAS32_20580 [Candidatus Peribacteraceae bacterium]|nr:hypothetical protein [Candidatus Peribacteraceae bacterium]